MSNSPYKILFSTSDSKYIFYDSRIIQDFDFSDEEHSMKFTGFDFPPLEEKPFGSLVIEIANMTSQDFFNYLTFSVFKDIFLRTVSPSFAYEFLIKKFSNEIAIGILNKIYDLAFVDEDHSTSYIYDYYFHNWINSLYNFPSDFCKNYVMNGDTFSLTNSPRKIELYISFNNNIFNSRYSITDLRQLLYFDVGKIVENNILIKQCSNCGKYFIPEKRKDEIYCNNIFRSGHTCREIGPALKIKNDVFKSAYRSAYKTQRARIKYHSNDPTYEDTHVKPWIKAAKKALSDFSTMDDIDGFKKWLNENKDVF